MSKPEWSLVEYRKAQASKEFELAPDLVVIYASPSNDDEVANQMRILRAGKEAERYNKLMEEAERLFESDESEHQAQAEVKVKEATELNRKGLDYLVENLRTQVLDPDGKKVAFTRLRKCFGNQDEVVALLNAMQKVRQEADPQSASNGSAS